MWRGPVGQHVIELSPVHIGWGNSHGPPPGLGHPITM
jgi:hypothetical protein